MHRSALSPPEPVAGLAPAIDPPAARAPGAARPAHVCLVAPLAWPVLSGDRNIRMVGGAEVQQSILARAFAAAGYRTSMVCLDYGQPDGVELDGIRVLKAHRLDEGIPVVRFLHPRLTAMWRAMSRADADVYYFRCSSALVGFGAAFCRHHGRRSIYAGASDIDFVPGRQQIRYGRDRWLYEYGLKRVDAIIAQNSAQRGTCLANYGREAVIIPSCYRAPDGASADPRGPVLWAGAVRDYKGPEHFLDMARRLPGVRFVMIGGAGSDEREALEYYRRIEREARSIPNLEFAGFVAFGEVESYFDRASVVVNTSRFEGFPNTFLQAWARGIPAVGMVDTGSRLDGRPVYAVVRDAAEGAAEIERLLKRPQYWEQASERCLAYFRQTHSVEAAAARYARLFSALLQRRGEAA